MADPETRLENGNALEAERSPAPSFGLDTDEEWLPTETGLDAAPARPREDDSGVPTESWRESQPETQDGAPDSASSWASDASERTTGEGTARGIAKDVQERTEQYETTWIFRVDRHDPSGSLIDSIPVEVRGVRMVGYIGENHLVEVSGMWKYGTLLAKRARNLSTGAEVRGLGFREAWEYVRKTAEHPKRLRVALIVVVAIVALATGGALFYNLRSHTPSNLAGFKDETSLPAGDASTTVSASTTLTIPDVVGVPTGIARFRLLNAGFTQSHMKFMPGRVGAFPHGCEVTSIDPEAGSSVDKSTTVTVRYLRDPNFECQ